MARSSPSVSVIVLAFNEAGNLPAAIASIDTAIAGKLTYEIIVIDDGSSDNTSEVAEAMAKQHQYVRVLHNQRNMGCGYTFARGISVAKYKYVWVIPGDGEIPQDSLEAIVDAIGTADMILPYMINSNIRPVFRRVISWGYTTLLNVLFLKRLHYYNGPGVFLTDKVHYAPEVHSRGFAFMAPIILTLMKRKASWKEVGILLKERDCGKPSINNVLNVISGLTTTLRLYWELNIKFGIFRKESGYLSKLKYG